MHNELENLIGNYKKAEGELKFPIGDEIDRKVNDLIIMMRHLALDQV